MFSLGYLEGMSNVILCNRCLNLHSLTIVVSWIFCISINVITIYPNAQVENLESSLIALYFLHCIAIIATIQSISKCFGLHLKKYSTSVYFFLFLVFSAWSKSLLSPVLITPKVSHLVVSLLLVFLYNPHKSQNTTLKTCHIFSNPSVASYHIRIKSKLCDPLGSIWSDPAFSYDFCLLYPSLSKLLPHSPSRMGQNLSSLGSLPLFPHAGVLCL